MCQKPQGKVCSHHTSTLRLLFRKQKMSKCIDLTGQKFGRLTVIERAENAKDRHSQWLCRCDCGKTLIVRGKSIRSGDTKSCGCYSRNLTIQRNYKHGHSKKDRIYNIWNAMKKRCYYKKDKCYKDYGERGISVCKEWLHDFQTFYNWAMANGYKEDLSLDRINVNGNYEPSNCRWATNKEQANNTRRNRTITYQGKIQTIKQWANEININYHTLYSRIYTSHWDIEKALTTLLK